MHIDTNNLSPILSELTVLELDDLVDRYCFSNEPVANLVTMFHLKCGPNKLVRILPLIKTDFTCPYCKQDLVRKILSKGLSDKFGEPFCRKCSHTQDIQCTCLKCKKIAFDKENYFSKKDVIEKYLAKDKYNYFLKKVEDLTLKDALYLICLIQTAENISFKEPSYVGPTSKVQKLAPYANTIVYRHLIKQNLISISPNSEETAFVIKNNSIDGFNFMHIKWRIHLENFEVELIKLKGRIEISDWPLNWTGDIKEVWFEISTFECIEYIQFVANERNFSIEITDNLLDVVLSLLRSYSVSQCFSLITKIAKETSDSLVRNITNEYDAGDYFIRALLQRNIKHKNHKKIKRPCHFTMSQLSYFFHYEVLKIGNAGFTSLPHGIK